MKVLVTGGAGFIGSHVVDLYLEQGYEVVVVDNLSTGRITNLNPAAKFYQEDIRRTQLEEIFLLEQPDFVNHHAAQMNIRHSINDPVYDADVNILGSINVIECARKFKVKRFIYISSGGAVYGEPEYLPCDESHPVKPICPYGASKHTVEHYLFMYHINYGLECTILRYANVYGPRQDPKGEAGVVAIFTGQMLNSQKVVINGDGEQQRDFVYVNDCARANLLALTAKNSFGIYNIGCGKATSINEIYHSLKAIIGNKENPCYGPAKIGETRSIFLSTNAAKQDLGWSPEVELSEGLGYTVDYFHGMEQSTSIHK
jgi:UDP-glucose 4-epimerase